MAPLKHYYLVLFNPLLVKYPCLKGHGPIEASSRLASPVAGCLYPCLKGHGPIEAKRYASTKAYLITCIHA